MVNAVGTSFIPALYQTWWFQIQIDIHVPVNSLLCRLRLVECRADGFFSWNLDLEELIGKIQLHSKRLNNYLLNSVLLPKCKLGNKQVGEWK